MMGFKWKPSVIQRYDEYGALTVMKFVRSDSRNRGYYACYCICGNIKDVRQDHLRSGMTRSCGCRAHLPGHGMTGTPEYIAWSNMIQRCTNPRHPNYADYGGRGITVCESWRKFENFYEDMGKSRGLTLERRDNNKGYEPDNCEWATWQTQARNKR